MFFFQFQINFRTLDHLDYLVHTKRLPEILNIIPMKCFSDDELQMMSKAQGETDNGSNGI